MDEMITPWSATVQPKLQQTLPLTDIEINSYRFQVKNTGDSIWLLVQWPSSGSIAFRLAYGMNSPFKEINWSQNENHLQIFASNSLGSFKIDLILPESGKNLFRYTTRFTAHFPFLINFYPRDIVPLTQKGSLQNTAGKIHLKQEGGRSGQLYFSMTRPKVGSVFYFQNLSAISGYCDCCETSLMDSVGGDWPEIDYQFPLNPKKPISENHEFVLSDAYIVLTENIPADNLEISLSYLEFLGEVYKYLPKPETSYTDWPSVAEKALDDLNQNKGCWIQIEGTPFLNAYVSDYKTPAEIMVQLAVLLPLKEYLEWKKKEHPVVQDLRKGIEDFYDKNIRSIVRWHPSIKKNLDESEEQKEEMVMDSWYLHHPLLNLSRLALKGDKNAEKLFLKSIDYAIKVAKHFNYKWPVFYKMTTLEVIKKETIPGEGGEKDVPGSYAHIMLMAYKLTREKRFLNEAIRSAKKLKGLGFEIFYQANNTAFSAAAMVELYKETGNKDFLEISYACLAGIFKNVRIWESDYGHAKFFENFFAVYPLNDAPYTAAYEEMEVYAALYNYLKLTDGLNIPATIKLLVSEFIKYTPSRLIYYYPIQLPEQILTEKTKTGEIKKDLWIPLEDLQDGWEPNGQVGQEVYGAGLPFGIVSRQYHRIKNSDIVFFLDYPLKAMRQGKNKITFKILGHGDFTALLKFIKGNEKIDQILVEQKQNSTYEKVSALRGQKWNFHLKADSKIRITWSLKKSD